MEFPAGARAANAAACYQLLDLPYPIVVDKEDNKVKEAWSGWPIRLMVANTEGKLVSDGGRGPGGFNLKNSGPGWKTIFESLEDYQEAPQIIPRTGSVSRP